MARKVAPEPNSTAMTIWTLEYDSYDPAQEGLREALCTLGNGYFATRGAAPEAEAGEVHYPGTYVAGCYNRLVSDISGESVENESLVNVPNWLCLTFRIEDEDSWFDLSRVELLSFGQKLELASGVLHRTLTWRDDAGRETTLRQRRLVHMGAPHLAALEMSLTPENWSGRIVISSALDGRVENDGVDRYRKLASDHLEPLHVAAPNENTIFLKARTRQSRIEIAEAARTVLARGRTGYEGESRNVADSNYVARQFVVEAKQGSPVVVEKVVSLYTSRDKAISECGQEACKSVARAPDFDELLETHTAAWKDLWSHFDIALDVTDYIENGRAANLILHLHVFHILQTVSLNSMDLDVGIPARGLHGEAYRGHVFWDEFFVFPFLNLRMPEISRSLLLYRYRRLDEARAAARDAGYEGAMYPWQSGSNGQEETQEIHLNPRSGRWNPDNSHLQRHVNIAIAYNLWQYYQVTGDVQFMGLFGASMLVEIARFWASLVSFNEELERYEILGVMGPDEYHDALPGTGSPGLDNNAYTNVMAVWVLCKAREALDLVPENRSEALRQQLELKQEELDFWDDISRRMRVVFHGDGIISQFEGYENLAELDWDHYRDKYGDIQRMDRILEAEGDSPNHYKVSKQADVLMLYYLLSAEELSGLFERLGYELDQEAIPRNIDYYLARTSHGSTLSRVVHSWVLARSDRPGSWDLFAQALESDISDIQGGTTAEGIHLGAMAGTVDHVQRCYTGVETREDILWLDPKLPEELRQLDLRICYRGHCIEMEINHERLHVRSIPSIAETVKLGFGEDVFELRARETREFSLKKKN